MGIDSFPPRPESRPTVCACTNTRPQYAGLLKVVYTTIKAEERLDAAYCFATQVRGAYHATRPSIRIEGAWEAIPQ